jgi:hypothetical protein
VVSWWVGVVRWAERTSLKEIGRMVGGGGGTGWWWPALLGGRGEEGKNLGERERWGENENLGERIEVMVLDFFFFF